MNIFFFALTWIALLGGLFFYVGRRMIRTSAFSPSRSAAAWVGLAFLVVLPLLVFLFALRKVESGWANVMAWGAYIALGLFSYLLVLTFVRDLAVFPLWIRKKTSNTGTKRLSNNPVNEYDPARRQFLFRASNYGIVGISSVSTMYGIYEAHGRMTVETVDVPIRDLPAQLEGLRIVQFTDLHIGPTIKRPFVEDIVNRIKSLNGDMIVFTGDLVDGTVGGLRHDAEPLSDLRAKLGNWFVTGNHEYYSGVLPWIAEAQRLGFSVLLNEHAVVEHNGARFVLAGVTDYSGGQFIKGHASDPVKALRGAPAGIPRILLAHQPKSIHEAQRAGYDLQLSGHTHGGQYLPMNILSAIAQPYVRGLHDHMGSWVYVSRGVGYWGPPLRTGIPAEITVIRLTSGADALRRHT